MESQDYVLHVKFAIASYLDCKIENIYSYSLKESLGKVNPTVGARLITTEVEMINSLCERLYPEDIARRKLLYQDYLDRKSKFSIEDLMEPCNIMPTIEDIYQVRPTLCEVIVHEKLEKLIRDSGCSDLICNSSGGQDLVITLTGCRLNLHLKNGTDHCHRFDLSQCLES